LTRNEWSKRQSGLLRVSGAAATRTAAALLGVAFGCAALLIGASRADESSGASIFATRCAVCHGPQAAGIPGTFPSLHEQVVAFAKSEQGRDYLIMVLTSGLMGELKVGGIRYNNVMPAQSGLSEADVAAVLSYLASGLGKNEQGAAAVSTSDVKEARARHAQNSAPSTRTLRPTDEP
jgi:mono/diheme cytochrome c family protein